MRHSSRLDGKYHHRKPAECWVKGAESAHQEQAVHPSMKGRKKGSQVDNLHHFLRLIYLLYINNQDAWAKAVR